MAWLNAVPKDAKKSRMDMLAERNSALLEMPTILAGDWLISALFEIGPIRPMAMGGCEPIGPLEIAAHASNHGIKWQSWEATALREMSATYSEMLMRGADRNCPPPYVEEVEITPDRRQQVDGFFRALVTSRKPRKRRNG